MAQEAGERADDADGVPAAVLPPRRRSPRGVRPALAAVLIVLLAIAGWRDITIRRAEEGDLRLTGLSPAFSRKAADDRTAAFGEHA